jgi:hypothetical protein
MLVGAGGALTVPQRRQLLRLSVMCGDVSSSVRNLEQHLLWAGLLAEEFHYQVCRAPRRHHQSVIPGHQMTSGQSDDETFQGCVSSLPKTRTLGELATSQCGFIAFIAKPVLKLWDGIFGRESYVQMLSSHLAFWKAVGAARYT